MSLKIIELAAQAPKYIEVDTQDIPACGPNYAGANRPYYKATQLPSKILIVSSIRPYRNGYEKNRDEHELMQIDYVNPLTMKPTYCIVPNDFLASILPAEQLADLESKFEKAQFENLTESCRFYGQSGSDPEIFVTDENDQVIPAFKFLGSKKEPSVLSKVPGAPYKLNNAYWDGFQAEFDTSPSPCLCYHADSVQYGLKTVLNYAKQFNPKAKLSVKTVVDISPELMADAKPEHVQFGCMPSFNAYGMHGLDKSGDQVPFRPAGGHIHLSLDSGTTKEQIEKMVKGMDAILGVACVSMFASFDNPKRRELYGLAGEYRMPKHGMEYRVLSNAWLIHPVIMHMVFDLGRTAAMFGARDLLKYWQCDQDETIRIINTCDVAAARQVLEKNKELLLKLIAVRYEYNLKTFPHYFQPGEVNVEMFSKYTYNAFLNGLESIIKDPADFEENWLLNGNWIPHSDSPSKNVMQVFKAKAQDGKI